MAEASRWEFDWDDANLRHLARHRISREEFEEAMSSDPVYVDFRDESGEPRWYVIGMSRKLRLLHLVFTIRGEATRPVTGWDAGRELYEYYFHQKSQ